MPSTTQAERVAELAAKLSAAGFSIHAEYVSRAGDWQRRPLVSMDVCAKYAKTGEPSADKIVARASRVWGYYEVARRVREFVE